MKGVIFMKEEFKRINERQEEMARRGYFELSPKSRQERLDETFSGLENLANKIIADAHKFAQEVSKDDH